MRVSYANIDERIESLAILSKATSGRGGAYETPQRRQQSPNEIQFMIDQDEKSAPASRVRFGVLAWLCSMAMLAYVQRNSISLAEDEIRSEFQLTQFEMGLVFSSFLWAYALAQIPASWLAQRWGSRICLAAFMFVSSITTALSGLLPSLSLLVAARVSCGFVQAGMFPACASTLTKWFSPADRGVPSGFLSSFMSVGGIIASSLTGLLLSMMIWKPIMVYYAIPGLIWVALFFVRFRNRPEEVSTVSELELAKIRDGVPVTTGNLEESNRNPIPWMAILSTRSLWAVCGQQFFRAAGYIFFATWFPKYLQAVHGVTTLQSGLLASLPMLGVILGGPLGGTFSDWLYRRTQSRTISRKLPGAISQYLCGAIIALAYSIDSPVLAVLVISTGTFVFAFGGCCAYTVTMDIAGKQVPIVFAIMNMSGNIGAALSPIIVGEVADRFGWQPVLFLFAAIYVAAGICWTLLDASKVVGE